MIRSSTDRRIVTRLAAGTIAVLASGCALDPGAPDAGHGVDARAADLADGLASDISLPDAGAGPDVPALDAEPGSDATPADEGSAFDTGVDTTPASDAGDTRDVAVGYLDAGSPVVDRGFPDPAVAGFHHAALIYHHATPRAPLAFAPYLAWQQGGHPRPGAWLFDAYVFLAFAAPSGVALDQGASTMADWNAMLDAWLGPMGSSTDRGEVGALEAGLAATTAATTTAGGTMGPPPDARRVVLAMPWLDPSVAHFGDVDGDGVSENLALPGDRAKVARWYAAAARARFAARGYHGLRLWGLYLMREDASIEDQRGLPGVTAAVHANGLAVLWIPYFAAPGWDAWRSLGIDVAVMQPSYAFRSWLDGGRVRRDRLHDAEDLASGAGLGVEVEVRGRLELAAERRMLAQYLADASAYGSQRGATAYFLGEDVVEHAPSSTDASVRATYDALAAFVSGQLAPEPDASPAWRLDHPAPGTLRATATLAAPVDLRSVRVELDEPAASAWLGTVALSVQREGSTVWQAAGYSLRGSRDEIVAGMRSQSIDVPVGAPGAASRVTALELDFQTPAGSPAPALSRIALDPDASFRPEPPAPPSGYAVAPALRGAPTYPDTDPVTARPRLTDGLISSVGWTGGRSVGWNRDPGVVVVTFDLGSVRSVAGVRLYAHGGTEAGINWPLNAAAIFSTDAPLTSPEDAGALPANASALPFGDPNVTGWHGPYCQPDHSDCTDLDGYLDVTPAAPVLARYVTLFAEAHGWVMLDEVRITAPGGAALSANYTTVTRPTSPDDPSTDADDYADDGARLTDGVVAEDFLPALVSGWHATSAVSAVAQLATARNVTEVTVWSQDLAEYGIVPPASVAFATSLDGSHWTNAGAASAPAMRSSGAVAFRMALPASTRAAFVRAQAPAGSAGWTMLSEIEVR